MSSEMPWWCEWFTFLLLCLCVPGFESVMYLKKPLIGASDHTHYIAAVEVEWDYAPSGQDQVNANNSNAEFYIKGGPNRIGSKYKKAVYREYTDATFTVQKSHPAWLGIMGPLLRVNMTQQITVIFKNLASRPYSINVPGGFIKEISSTEYVGKRYEGAVYDDGTQGLFKMDDAVPPGGEWTYVWAVSYDDGPGVLEDRCIPWIYHSHVDAVRDVEAGLIGVIMACRKDAPIANDHRERLRKHIDRDFVLLWKIFDENLSWYIEDNMKNYTDTSVTDKTNADFIQSNRMHSANGYVFGNLPGLVMCRSEYVGWFLVGYGGKFDVHSVTFNGHTLIYDDERTDMISITPSESASSRMVALNPGKWLIRCAVHEHYQAGMKAVFTVNECASSVPLTLNKVKANASVPEWEYFIAAEEVVWDYGPTGTDQLTGLSLTRPGSKSERYFSRTKGGLGGVYKKARYVQYTDATFSVKTTPASSEEHMGLLGPIIRATVGSNIKVVFKNLASRAYSIHARGVLYDKANEGMPYEDGTSGVDQQDDAVAPGATYTYHWSVPNQFYRMKYYQRCATWTYSSGVDPVKDVHSGLVGPLLICRETDVNITTGQQVRHDREIFLHMSVIDEGQSWYYEENVQTYGSVAPSVSSQHSSLKRHNINGYMYANMPLVDMACKTEENTVHLMSTGGQADFFSMYFHGEHLREEFKNRPFSTIQPGQARTLNLKPYQEGEWAITAGKFSFTESGMTAKYKISNCSQANPNDTVTKFTRLPYRGYERTYYMAAVEIEWDYAPIDRHLITGEKLSIPESPGYMYVSVTNNTLGKKYKKAVYREYTDASFTVMKDRTDDEKYLGILGPVIKGGAGDTISVVFKNLASRPYSIHPVGILTNKTDEGYGYQDGTSGDAKRDDAVSPGGVHTYRWHLPTFSAPTYNDAYCISLTYHSAVDPTRDVNSGLVGPLYICKGRLLDVNLTRTWPSLIKDYKEFFLLFAIFDENHSWYLQENVDKYMTNKKVDLNDPMFVASNKMHAINGFIFGTMPLISQLMSTWSDFYLMSSGSQDDVHAPHFNSAPFTNKYKGSDRNLDTVLLMPGAALSVEVHRFNFRSPGKWLIRCAVNEHFQNGMMAEYQAINQFSGMIDLMNTLKPSAAASWWSGLAQESRVLIILGVCILIITVIVISCKVYRRRTRSNAFNTTEEVYMNDMKVPADGAV